MKINDIKDSIVAVPDFPKKDILFRDITPLFLDPEKINFIISEMEKIASNYEFDAIVAPESRGYLFGLPLSLKMNKPFIMVRKPGKLPRKKLSIEYDLEYGSNILEIHEDDIKPNWKVIIIDDLLATGGTSLAIEDLLKKLKAKPVAHIYLIELENLAKKDNFNGEINSLIKF